LLNPLPTPNAPSLVKKGICFVLLCLLTAPSWADGDRNPTARFFDAPFYIQFQHGFASDTDFGPSLLFLTDAAQEKTTYQGLSLGRQLGTSLFGWDVDVVGYLGIQNFRERGFQPDSYGLSIYWKVYRQWTPRWFSAHLPLRLGLGQGLSYISRIPVAEQRDFEPLESAETIHYLEWSVQLPLNGFFSIFGHNPPNWSSNTWLGYNIFHRSTVFGLFADSAGGINYPGISIEYIFKH